MGDGTGDVSVGGVTGISVGVGGMSVGSGVSVGVGGGGVAVGCGVLVGRGVLVRVGRGRALAVAVARGRRVRVGWRGVKEGTTVAVSEGRGMGVREAASVAPTVGVRTNAVTACSVNAAAVPRLSTAISTRFNGSIVVLLLFKSLIASAETLHSRLNPMTPAARTPSGPAYSLNRTLVALLFVLICKGSFGARCNEISLFLHSCRIIPQIYSLLPPFSSLLRLLQ